MVWEPKCVSCVEQGFDPLKY